MNKGDAIGFLRAICRYDTNFAKKRVNESFAVIALYMFSLNLFTMTFLLVAYFLILFAEEYQSGNIPEEERKNVPRWLVSQMKLG